MSRILLSVVVALVVSAPVFAACVPAGTSCSTTVTGRLESGDCIFSGDGSFYDQWTFQGTVGQVIVVDMKSGPIDTYLALMDPLGNFLAENDDHPLADTTDSQMTFTLTSTGTWTIIANSFEAGETGDYTVQLKCGNPLLVNNNRYRVTVNATDPNGKTEVGVPVKQTDLFGWFSLPGFTGNPGNPEIFSKVVGPVNGVPWVFYAGLTNLAYEITMQDSQTNTNYSTYFKPAPPPGSLQSYGDYDVAGSVSPSCANVTVTSGQTAATTCADSTSAICLLGRFRVTLHGKDNPTRTNNQGPGQALPINTNFGFFSIPALSNDATNIEAFVKMVDGRGLNQRFWVFLGGLTDFDLTITVTDTTTGAQKIYSKPPGSTCGWNDTSAF